MYKTDDAAEAYFGRILSCFHLGKLSEAAADFEKTKDLIPKYADAFYYRGLVNHQFKKYLAAISDFNSAIEFNPKNANTKYYAARGLAYEALGKTNEAEADFAKAKELEK
jgi:tetratricopeptide (TPR) repeat protein